MDKIDNSIEKKLWDFLVQMQNVLNEKHEKYKDTWKTVNLHFLRHKLRNQLDKTILNDNKLKDYSMKRLIHIANYCYFLYTRLGDK